MNRIGSFFRTIGNATRGAIKAVGGLFDSGVWNTSSLFSNFRTTSGENITPTSALKVLVYYACIRVISEDIAKIPFSVYKKTGENSKAEEPTHPVYKLLIQPNSEMSWYSFCETMQSWALGWGNGIAKIDMDDSGNAVALWPIHPSRVEIVRNEEKELRYKVRVAVGSFQIYRPEEVIHIKNFSDDGINGWSLIKIAAEALGLSLAMQTFGASFFGNGAHAGGFLEHPGELGEPAKKSLIASFEERHQGAVNAHRVTVLEEGMKYNRTTIANNEAQFIESRQFQIEEICRLCRVPPHKVQHLLRATFSNIEHQSIDYVGDTLLPWYTKWEQEFNNKLFFNREKGIYYTKFSMQAILRADMSARATFYNKLFQMGVLSPDDIRALEDLNPLPNGTGAKYYIPMNLVPIEDAGKVAAAKVKSNKAFKEEPVEVASV